MEWLCPQFIDIPPEKRRFFCKSFVNGSQKSGDLIESKSTQGHKTQFIESLQNEVSSERMNIEIEISNSAVRAISDWNAELHSFPLVNNRNSQPTVLVLFCGPPPMKIALIEACKAERQRNRVNLILEVQCLNF